MLRCGSMRLVAERGPHRNSRGWAAERTEELLCHCLAEQIPAGSGCVVDGCMSVPYHSLTAGIDDILSARARERERQPVSVVLRVSETCKVSQSQPEALSGSWTTWDDLGRPGTTQPRPPPEMAVSLIPARAACCCFRPEPLSGTRCSHAAGTARDRIDRSTRVRRGHVDPLFGLLLTTVSLERVALGPGPQRWGDLGGGERSFTIPGTSDSTCQRSNEPLAACGLRLAGRGLHWDVGRGIFHFCRLTTRRAKRKTCLPPK